MRTIYKYKLENLTGHPSEVGIVAKVEIPWPADILKVTAIGDDIYVYANVFTKNEGFETVEFRIFGTGWDMTWIQNIEYLDTVFMDNGLVWHVYEKHDGKMRMTYD